MALRTPASPTAPRARTPGRGAGSGSPLERVTVNLTARSSHALDEVVRQTGDSKTDSLNRAIRIYAYIEQILQAGGTIHVRETPDSEPERLKISDHEHDQGTSAGGRRPAALPPRPASASVRHVTSRPPPLAAPAEQPRLVQLKACQAQLIRLSSTPSST